jgi:FkbM family methyltransferase
MLDWRVAYADYDALVDLFTEIFVRKHYPFEQRRPRPFVVDCGANIGVASLYFKTIAPDAQVLAFEPNPTAFRLLETNMRHNGIADDVECVPLALAREPGIRTLHVPAPAHGGASLEFAGEGWSPVAVEAVRLSDRIGDRQVDFLKIDVEGSETAILDDLGENGVLSQVDEIVLEHHPRNARDLAGLLGKLADADFECRVAVVSDAFWSSSQLLLVHAFRATEVPRS